jgi:hypothetical protein
MNREVEGVWAGLSLKKDLSLREKAQRDMEIKMASEILNLNVTKLSKIALFIGVRENILERDSCVSWELSNFQYAFKYVRDNFDTILDNWTTYRIENLFGEEKGEEK